MKQCPYCGRNFGFTAFIARCGTDTLTASSKPGCVPRREHICPGCRRHFWLEYPALSMKDNGRKSALAAMAAGLLFLWGVVLFLRMPLPEAAGLAVFGGLVCWPAYRTWVKYKSVRLRAA